MKSRSNSKHLRQMGAVLFVSLVLLSGCGKEQSESADPANLSTETIDILTASARFLQDDAFLETVEDQLVGDCMRKKSFEYPYVARRPASPESSSQRDLDIFRTSGYSLAQRFEARTTGDQMDGDGSTTAVTHDAIDEHLQGLSSDAKKAWTTAFGGSEDQRKSLTLSNGSQVSMATGGCLGQARKDIYGDFDTYLQLKNEPQRVRIDGTNRVVGDPEYVAIADEWSECMKSKGYDYDLPSSAQEDLSAQYTKLGVTAELRAKEIAVAVADGECAETHNTQARIAELINKSVLTMNADTQRLLLQMTEVHKRVMTHARELLDETSKQPTS